MTFGGGEQNGISFQANGSETRYDNILVAATNSVSLKSGADTQLIGAQVAGKTVSADVGGNLNIQSLQDQGQYQSESSSAGFSVSLCVPPICAGVPLTGLVSLTSTTIDHHYQSAQGQSGIAAGEGGFDIQVKGNTALQGGAITSAATADKNSLSTARLTSTDLQNTQKTDVDSSSFSASYSGAGTASTLLSNAASDVLSNAVAGVGLPESNDQRGTTQSVVSAGHISITGTGDKATDAASATNVAMLTSRDPKTANGALTDTLTLQQAARIVGGVLTNRFRFNSKNI